MHITMNTVFFLWLPSWISLVAQTVERLPIVQETQVLSLGQEDPLEEGTAPTPVFLPGEPMDRGVRWAKV